MMVLRSIILATIKRLASSPVNTIRTQTSVSIFKKKRKIQFSSKFNSNSKFKFNSSWTTRFPIFTKSNSNYMSIQPHGLSTLTRDIASINNTIASAADAGAPNSSAFWSSFCVIKNNGHQSESYLIRNLFYFRFRPNLSVPLFQSSIKLGRVSGKFQKKYHFQPNMACWVVIYSIYNSFIHLLICLFIANY